MCNKKQYGPVYPQWIQIRNSFYHSVNELGMTLWFIFFSLKTTWVNSIWNKYVGFLSRPVWLEILYFSLQRIGYVLFILIRVLKLNTSVFLFCFLSWDTATRIMQSYNNIEVKKLCSVFESDNITKPFDILYASLCKYVSV